MVRVSTKEEAIKYMWKMVEIECVECKKVFSRKVRSDRPRTYSVFLCPKCSRVKTCLEKFGHSTNLIVHSNPKKVWADKHDEILAKIKETTFKRYGTESPLKNKEISAKALATKLRNNSFEKQKESSKRTKLKRYGDENYHNIEKFKETIRNYKSNFEKENNCSAFQGLVETYGQGFKSLNLPKMYDEKGNAYISNEYLQTIIDYASKNHRVSTSKGEKELYKYIKSIYIGEIKSNVRKLVGGFELDIYLPELKVAFEYNGIYFHSSNKKDKYYHQDKTKACYNAGIRLAHILEPEWQENREMVKDKVKRLLFTNESFNDGFFPSTNLKVILSEPRKHKIWRWEYYDTGVEEVEES